MDDKTGIRVGSGQLDIWNFVCFFAFVQTLSISGR